MSRLPAYENIQFEDILVFGFPVKEREQGFMFKSNMLKTVILQLKYAHNDKILEQEEDIRVQLKHKYANINTRVQNEVKIKIVDKTPLLQQSVSAAKGVELRTSDNGIAVVFATDNMTVTIAGNVYSNFNQVFDDIVEEFLPYLRKAEVKNITRCAIRKVNLVGFKSEGDAVPADALPLVFNKLLVDNLLFLPCSPNLASGITRFNAAKDGFQLNISYGLVHSKSSTKQQQHLVLDIDLFKRENETELDDLREVMNEINNEIFNIFCWAIHPDFLANLNQ